MRSMDNFTKLRILMTRFRKGMKEPFGRGKVSSRPKGALGSWLLPCSTATLLLIFPVIGLVQERTAPSHGYRDWKAFGGGLDNIHYSALRQINRDNVQKLTVAWTYDSGDAFPASEMECNPIIAHGVLYATTPKLRLIALDAATGKLRWSFNPNESENLFGKLRNRGVNYREQGNDRRVFYAAHQYLYAVDAMTG